MPATAEKSAIETGAPLSPFQPVDGFAHEAEKARRKADRDAKRPELRKALDFRYAAQAEERKTKYEFKVHCKYSRPDKRGLFETKEAEHTVIAQNEKEAWALFCDKIQTWPGPNDCERTITQGKKV
jgi:hypothetical protein